MPRVQGLDRLTSNRRRMRRDYLCNNNRADYSSTCAKREISIDWKINIYRKRKNRIELASSSKIELKRWIDPSRSFAIKIYRSSKNSSRDAKPSFFLVCSSLVRRWPRLMDAFQGRSRRRCKQRFSIWSTCRQIVAEHDWGRPERAEGTRNIDETQKSLHLTPDILPKIVGLRFFRTD